MAASAAAASLAAFAAARFLVFGAGIWHMLRLFSRPPEAHEPGPPRNKPIRSAGITPAPSPQGGVDAGPQPQPAE